MRAIVYERQCRNKYLHHRYFDETHVCSSRPADRQPACFALAACRPGGNLRCAESYSRERAMVEGRANKLSD